MPNVRELNRANQVFHRLEQYSTSHRPASHLVASAARQVAFTRLATGMATWVNEPAGSSEMEKRLSDEQFDNLALASVDFAARSAMTCMDLCAAAAYRLAGGEVEQNGKESDVNHLVNLVSKDAIALGSAERAWLDGLRHEQQWSLLCKVRRDVTHRATESRVELGQGPPVTSFVVDGVPWSITSLTSVLASFVEAQFDAYCAAVLADFPSQPSAGPSP